MFVIRERKGGEEKGDATVAVQGSRKERGRNEENRGDERIPRERDTRTDTTNTITTTNTEPTRRHVPLAASSSSKTSFSAFACNVSCCCEIQDMLPPSIPSSSEEAHTRPTSHRPCCTNEPLHRILPRDANKDMLRRNSALRQQAGRCPQDIVWYPFSRRCRAFFGGI